MTDTPTTPSPPVRDVRPIPVHVASVADGVQPGETAAPSRVGCRAYTVVLTSTQPVQTILDQNDKRIYALIQAGGNDAVISNNKGEIGNAANTTTGLPNPIGMVLPYGNTGPTKIPGGDRWYAAAAAYPTQVTVLAVEEG